MRFNVAAFNFIFSACCNCCMKNREPLTEILACFKRVVCNESFSSVLLVIFLQLKVIYTCRSTLLILDICGNISFCVPKSLPFMVKLYMKLMGKFQRLYNPHNVGDTEMSGADSRSRTGHLLITSQLLYQMS